MMDLLKDSGVSLTEVKVDGKPSLYPSLDDTENVRLKSFKIIEDCKQKEDYQPEEVVKLVDDVEGSILTVDPSQKTAPKPKAKSTNKVSKQPQEKIIMKRFDRSPLKLSQMTEQYHKQLWSRVMLIRLIMVLSTTLACFVIPFGGIFRFGAYHIKPFLAATANATTNLTAPINLNDTTDDPGYLTSPINLYITETLLPTACMLFFNSVLMCHLCMDNIDKMIPMIHTCSSALSVPLLISMVTLTIHLYNSDLHKESSQLELRALMNSLRVIMVLAVLIVAQHRCTRRLREYMDKHQRLQNRLRVSFIQSKLYKLLYVVFGMLAFISIQLSPLQFGAPLIGCTDEVCPRLRVPFIVYFWPSFITLTCMVYGMANMFMEDLQPAIRKANHHMLGMLALNLALIPVVCSYMCNAHNLAVPTNTWLLPLLLCLYSILCWWLEKSLLYGFRNGCRRAMVFTRNSSVTFDIPSHERELLRLGEVKHKKDMLIRDEALYGKSKQASSTESCTNHAHSTVSNTNAASTDSTTRINIAAKDASTASTASTRLFIIKEAQETLTSCYTESSTKYRKVDGPIVCTQKVVSFLPGVVYLPGVAFYCVLYLRAVFAFTGQCAILMLAPIKIDYYCFMLAVHSYYCLRLLEQFFNLVQSETLPLQLMPKGPAMMQFGLLSMSLPVLFVMHSDPRVYLCLFLPSLIEFVYTMYLQGRAGTVMRERDDDAQEVYTVVANGREQSIAARYCVRPNAAAPGVTFMEDVPLQALSMNRAHRTNVK